MKKYVVIAGVCAVSAVYSFDCSFMQSLEVPKFEIAFAAPRSFGKTHFIVGHPESQPQASLPVEHSPSLNTQAFFSPDDNVRKELIALIDREQEAIYVAVYIITEPAIVQALTRAKKRGVKIEVVTDVGCLKERSNKVSVLCDCGCKLFIYNPPTTPNSSSLMHHKFALFCSNNGKSLVWTGSYNFTKAASSTNQENALIVADKKTFDQYRYQFKRLKNRSYRYGKKTA